MLSGAARPCGSAMMPSAVICTGDCRAEQFLAGAPENGNVWAQTRSAVA